MAWDVPCAARTASLTVSPHFAAGVISALPPNARPRRPRMALRGGVHQFLVTLSQPNRFGRVASNGRLAAVCTDQGRCAPPSTKRHAPAPQLTHRHPRHFPRISPTIISRDRQWEPLESPRFIDPEHPLHVVGTGGYGHSNATPRRRSRVPARHAHAGVVVLPARQLRTSSQHQCSTPGAGGARRLQLSYSQLAGGTSDLSASGLHALLRALQ